MEPVTYLIGFGNDYRDSGVAKFPLEYHMFICAAQSHNAVLTAVAGLLCSKHRKKLFRARSRRF